MHHRVCASVRAKSVFSIVRIIFFSRLLGVSTGFGSVEIPIFCDCKAWWNPLILQQKKRRDYGEMPEWIVPHFVVNINT